MKFDIRVGTCLAILAVSAACSKSPDAPTAPSAATQSSSAATADGATLKFNTPALVSPVERARAEDRRPTLIWANATAKYGEVSVAYDLQVETASAMVYEQTVGETPTFGAHLLPFDLEYDTVYYWRVRSRVGNDFGPWSAYAEFLSPSRAVAQVPTTPGAGPRVCAAPPSAMGPGETRKPRPNGSAVVRQVASAFPGAIRNSCQEDGGSWEFMDRVVDSLRSTDGRYAYNAKRGNMNDTSLDAISYFWGNHDGFNGSTQVYIFDIISGHCGASPSTFWGDVTDITYSSGTVGRSLYPRPGRDVTPTTCAAAAGQ